MQKGGLLERNKPGPQRDAKIERLQSLIDIVFEIYACRNSRRLLERPLSGESKFKIFVVKEAKEDEESSVLGSGKVSLHSSPIDVDNSPADLRPLNQVIPPEGHSFPIVVKPVKLERKPNLNPMPAKIDEEPNARSASLSGDQTPTHEPEGKVLIDLAFKEPFDIDKVFNGFQTCTTDMVFDRPQEEQTSPTVFEGKRSSYAQLDVDNDDLDTARIENEFKILECKSKSANDSRLSSIRSMESKPSEEEEAVHIDSCQMEQTVEVQHFERPRVKPILKEPFTAERPPQRLCTSSVFKPPLKTISPRPSVKRSPDNEIAGSYSISQSGTSLEINIPLILHKRTPTPRPLKSDVGLGQPPAKKTTDVYEILGVSNRKISAAKKTDTEGQPMLKKVDCKVLDASRDSSGSRLSVRRGACSRLSLKVDIGNIYINNLESRRAETSRSKYSTKAVEGLRKSSRLMKLTTNLDNTFNDAFLHRGIESRKKSLPLDFHIQHRKSLSSQQQRDSKRGMLFQKKSSASKSFEEGIELLRRQSVRSKPRQSPCSNPVAHDKKGSLEVEVHPMGPPSRPVTGSSLKHSFMHSAGYLPSSTTPRASLVQKVMQKLRIPTNKLHDPVLIQQLDSIMEKKPQNSPTKRLEALIKQTTTEKQASRLPTSYDFSRKSSRV